MFAQPWLPHVGGVLLTGLILSACGQTSARQSQAAEMEHITAAYEASRSNAPRVMMSLQPGSSNPVVIFVSVSVNAQSNF